MKQDRNVLFEQQQQNLLKKISKQKCESNKRNLPLLSIDLRKV